MDKYIFGDLAPRWYDAYQTFIDDNYLTIAILVILAFCGLAGYSAKNNGDQYAPSIIFMGLICAIVWPLTFITAIGSLTIWLIYFFGFLIARTFGD